MFYRVGSGVRGNSIRSAATGVSALLGGVSLLSLALGLPAFADDGGPAAAVPPAQTAQVLQPDAAGAAAPQATPAGQQSAPILVPPVSVVGTTLTPDQLIQQDGGEASGYRSDLLSRVGPLGAMNVLDAPYSYNVVPQALIENIQPQSPQQVFELMPSLQVTTPVGVGLGLRAVSRGFTVDQAEDGFRYVPGNNYDISIEDKERVELLSGLSGFLYGPTDPGGYLNYVLKRPTATPIANVTVGNAGGPGFYAHGDFGGPLGLGGQFGYRLNIVAQGGDTSVADQSVQRTLISGAFDWHIADNLLLQVDGSRSDDRLDGQTAEWNFTKFVIAAPNASNDYGEPYSFSRQSRNDVGAKLTWDVNDAVTFRSAAKYIDDRDDDLYVANETFLPSGAYSQFINHQVNWNVTTYDAYGFADLKFDTGPVAHKVSLGASANSYDTLAPDNWTKTITATGFNLFSESATMLASQAAQRQIDNLPAGTLLSSSYGKAYWLSRMVGDDITFTDSWSALAGLNYATIGSANQNLGIESISARKSALTPTGSLIYKPLPNVSIYATYIQGLENGSVAPTVELGLPVTNPGTASPTIDTQYEVGTKVKLDEALATFSLFDMTKASEVYLENSSHTAYTYAANGRERHRGAEIDLTGKVTDNLSLYGGVTAFQAKIISQPANQALVGTEPAGVSEVMAKMYAEYAIDAVPGLVVTGGVQYYGRQAVADPNTAFIPDYAVIDLGARYSTHVYGQETIFRLNIYNAANSNYWATAGGGSTVEGPPLTVMASAQVKF